MGHLIEYKARVVDVHGLEQKLSAQAGPPQEILLQTDTYFGVDDGYLKIRELRTDAELIRYRRVRTAGFKECIYHRIVVSNAAALKDILSELTVLRGIVEKRRAIYEMRDFRVHVDTVNDLGCYIEIEADQTVDTEDFRNILRRLGLDEAAQIAESYIDLIEQRALIRSRESDE